MELGTVHQSTPALPGRKFLFLSQAFSALLFLEFWILNLDCGRRPPCAIPTKRTLCATRQSHATSIADEPSESSLPTRRLLVGDAKTAGSLARFQSAVILFSGRGVYPSQSFLGGGLGCCVYENTSIAGRIAFSLAPMRSERAPPASTARSALPNWTASTRKATCATCSPASPTTPLIVSRNCSPGRSPHSARTPIPAPNNHPQVPSVHHINKRTPTSPFTCQDGPPKTLTAFASLDAVLDHLCTGLHYLYQHHEIIRSRTCLGWIKTLSLTLN